MSLAFVLARRKAVVYWDPMHTTYPYRQTSEGCVEESGEACGRRPVVRAYVNLMDCARRWWQQWLNVRWISSSDLSMTSSCCGQNSGGECARPGHERSERITQTFQPINFTHLSSEFMEMNWTGNRTGLSKPSTSATVRERECGWNFCLWVR